MTARATHWREDLIAALFGALLVAGLFLDGAHHLALAHGQDESLLSPWHLPLFVGFNACAIWTITRNDRLRAMLRGGRPAPGATAAAGPRPALGAAHIALVGLVIAALGTAGPPFGFLVAAGAVIVLGACVHAIVGPIGIDRRVGLAAGCAFALTAGAFGAAGLNNRHVSPAPQTAAGDSSTSSSVHEHHHAAAAPAAVAAAAPAAAKASAKPASHAAARPAKHRAAARHASTAATAHHVAAHRADTPTAASTTTAAHQNVVRHTASSRPVRRHSAPIVRHRVAAPAPVRHRAPSRPAPDRVIVKNVDSGFKPDPIPSVPSSGGSVQTTVTTTTSAANSPANSAPSSSTSPTSAPTPAPPPATTPARKGGPGSG